MSTRIWMALVVSALISGACGPPPSERPREGAPAIAEGRPARQDDASVLPPTLAPAPALAGVSPSPGAPASSATQPGTSVPSPSPSPSASAGYVIVATDGAGANVRTAPSTSASVITTLAEGTPVEVLGDPITAEGRAWRQIRAGGRDGWVVSVVVRPR